MSENYLISSGDAVYHYYHKSGGIYCRAKYAGGAGDEVCVYPEGSDGFAVYRDAAGNTHIICADPEREIVYLTCRSGEWSKYIISSAREELAPLKFMLMSDGTRLNLFFSAVYRNETMLIHCILGANAKPEIIDRLYPSRREFFLFQRRVYYTSSADVLGYKDFSDGKPSGFTGIADGGYMPYAAEYGDSFHIVYKRRHRIYFENEPVFEDFAAEMPVIAFGGDRLILQWKSGSFIRYITSFNGGKTWSTPMRFVNPGKAAGLYTAQDGDTLRRCYGTSSEEGVTLFGTQELFPKPKPRPKSEQPTNNVTAMEIKKLKIMIELVNGELSDVKKRLKALESAKKEDGASNAE